MPSPLVSFILLAYNQQGFVRAAIDGALSQTYENLQIILSDDASTDDTFAIMENAAREYRGPHQIVLNRNSTNLGIIRHLAHLMTLATGELVIAAAGDDISLPKRAQTIAHEWQTNRNTALFLHSGFVPLLPTGEIDRSLKLHARPNDFSNLADAFRRSFGVLGATGAWDRRVFAAFDEIDPACVAEDVVLPLRAALLGGVRFIPEELVHYRVGTATHQLRARQLTGAGLLLSHNRKRINSHLAICRQALRDLNRFGARPALVTAALEAKFRAQAEAVGFGLEPWSLGLMVRSLRSPVVFLLWARSYLKCRFASLYYRYWLWKTRSSHKVFRPV